MVLLHLDGTPKFTYEFTPQEYHPYHKCYSYDVGKPCEFDHDRDRTRLGQLESLSLRPRVDEVKSDQSNMFF